MPRGQRASPLADSPNVERNPVSRHDHRGTLKVRLTENLGHRIHGGPRVKIINEALLDEFRTAPHCEWCGRPTPGGCDPHHVFARGRSNGFRLDIRITCSLSTWCHDRAHRGKISRKQLLAIIAIRERRPAEEIELEIIRLRWAPKNSHLVALSACNQLSRSLQDSTGLVPCS
jgi:hypothetical protein